MEVWSPEGRSQSQEKLWKHSSKADSVSSKHSIHTNVKVQVTQLSSKRTNFKGRVLQLQCCSHTWFRLKTIDWNVQRQMKSEETDLNLTSFLESCDLFQGPSLG